MATTPSTAAAGGARLEPKTQAFIDALVSGGGPPIYTLTPQDAREVLRSVQRSSSPPHGVDLEDKTITDGGREVSLRIFRPQGMNGPLPVLLYVHGGGWVLGDQDTHARLVAELAAGTGAAAVFVNYTPSPEAKFPVAIEQSYSAARWVASHGMEMNLDGSRMAVVGDSVGGNMAAALTLLAKERGEFKFRFQVLFYPVTDAGMDTASYKEFASGPWLTQAAMEWFWEQYLPDLRERAQPLASPLRAPLDQLQKLPPALIITDENDVLRDEGEAYAHKLMQAGVTVTATRYLGTIHDFVMLNPVAATPATREAIAQAIALLKKALAPQ